MTQAVISLSGKQFLVSEGSKIIVDAHLDKKESETVSPDVLLLVKDGEPTIGKPLVKDASATLKVLKLQVGPKIITAKYQAKTRHHRKVGHRQPQTVLEVTKIVSK